MDPIFILWTTHRCGISHINSEHIMWTFHVKNDGNALYETKGKLRGLRQPNYHGLRRSAQVKPNKTLIQEDLPTKINVI
ncbi:unnamed protein product [Prunus armeniaca]|uniref:Uncharacterized protein n=1 Tax=Prunus armeniaca TaxID=36596 RepID=A0A6J5WQB0_PRUAR|nr:unnamed protein product [Prunus armeniaca]